ncbi:MAG TPA: tetratricopeptide repeat protein, partial [Longimicrobiales bacterium]|nr:tetratricopeptide repeat protein [Longimicrobiales bacterium]
SVLLRQDLDLPQTRPQGAKDLPVASFLSEDLDAYRALVEGQVLAMNDAWPAAEQAFARAAAADPTFASAHFALYQARAIQGNGQGAMPALEQAMQHLPRMPERATFLVKAEYFIMKQDMERAYNVAGMHTELYPDDLAGHGLRAQLQIFRGEWDAAIASYRRALELDPNQRELLVQIGNIEQQQGRFDRALEVFQEYVEETPNDVAGRLRVARAQQLLGRLADSQATLDRALLVDPTATEPQVELAILERSRGDVAAAVRRLESALVSAKTADDSMAVHSALATVHSFAGQMTRAIAADERAVATAARVMLPVQVVNRQMQSLDAYVRAGSTADARRILDGVKSRMTPPLDEMWRVGQLVMALEQRDSIGIREARDGVQRIIDAFGFQIMKPDVIRADAMLLELRGDWNGALAKYQELQALNPSGMNVRRDIARAYRNLGRLDEAQRILDDHLRMVPASPDSHMEAARIRLARGDKAGARTHVERVAQVWANADASFVPAAELRSLQQEVQ